MGRFSIFNWLQDPVQLSRNWQRKWTGLKPVSERPPVTPLINARQFIHESLTLDTLKNYGEGMDIYGHMRSKDMFWIVCSPDFTEIIILFLERNCTALPITPNVMIVLEQSPSLNGRENVLEAMDNEIPPGKKLLHQKGWPPYPENT